VKYSSEDISLWIDGVEITGWADDKPIFKETHEQIRQALIEFALEEFDKNERPKNPWYRKGRW
jgi:hypothetical protein